MVIRGYEDEPTPEPARPAKLWDMGEVRFLKNERKRVVGSVFSAESTVQRLEVEIIQ